tara:strand:- start:7882 stop:9255 length:1374 start_codon:yes stop_codon:yes gene_type:complete
MSNFLYSIFGFVIAIGVLITFHELGHYTMARLFDVKVLRFSLGIGKPVWRRTFGSDRTEFVLSLIPLGGYVRMLDTNDLETSEKDRKRSFVTKSLLARSLIVLAGPIANFCLAIIFLWVTLIIGVPGYSTVIGHVEPGELGEKMGFEIGDRLLEFDGRKIQTWNEYDLQLLKKSLSGDSVVVTIMKSTGKKDDIEIVFRNHTSTGLELNIMSRKFGLLPLFPESEPLVASVLNKSPADQAGIKSGDIITKINQVYINNWTDLVDIVSQKPNREIEIQLNRNNEILILRATPELYQSETGAVGRLGIARDTSNMSAAMLRLNYLNALERSMENTWLLASVTVIALVEMVKLKISPKTIGGPVTIARVAGQSMQISMVSYLLFLAVVSISIGVLNLLPIPILDGGHLLYLILEAIRGQPISAEAMQIGQLLGIGALGVLMSIALYNDFSNIVYGLIGAG